MRRLIVKNDWYFILEQYEIPMTLTEIRIKKEKKFKRVEKIEQLPNSQKMVLESEVLCFLSISTLKS